MIGTLTGAGDSIKQANLGNELPDNMRPEEKNQLRNGSYQNHRRKYNHNPRMKRQYYFLLRDYPKNKR